uniref:Uncharacterized protein n=1 Tax=Rhizophora mucronata TaxID=61149 RepID=A0A2P2L5S2_RHIMU
MNCPFPDMTSFSVLHLKPTLPLL